MDVDTRNRFAAMLSNHEYQIGLNCQKSHMNSGFCASEERKEQRASEAERG